MSDRKSKAVWAGALAGALALGWGGLGALPAFAESAEAETEVVGDPAAGRRKAGACRTCHGLDGVAQIPVAPHIGGEDAGYLTRQLQAFRDGSRENEMMTVVTRSLSNQDIADLAAWYAALIPAADIPEGHMDDAPELCLGCHGEDGRGVNPDAPNLTGESVIYLVLQLKAFRSGAREHEMMNEIAAEMTDAEMREAATWFEAIGFSTTRPPE